MTFFHTSTYVSGIRTSEACFLVAVRIYIPLAGDGDHAGLPD